MMSPERPKDRPYPKPPEVKIEFNDKGALIADGVCLTREQIGAAIWVARQSCRCGKCRSCQIGEAYLKHIEFDKKK